MLILLPPSEGKSAPLYGAPLDLAGLVFSPELDDRRQKLIAALVKLGRRPVGKAVEVMGISRGQAGEVELNARLATEPTAPACELYAGVLYDRLGLAGLGSPAIRRSEENLLIASGLWGMVRPGDLIPYYRFSMKPKLPKIGGLAAFWRGPLGDAMAEAGHDRPGELVLDMRSGAYSAAWKPRHADLVPVRVFTGSGSDRKVVSHMAKAVRGEVARMVLTAGRLPDRPAELVDLVETAGSSAGLEAGLVGGALEVTVPAGYLKAA